MKAIDEQRAVGRGPAAAEVGQFQAMLQACALGDCLPGVVLMAPWGHVPSANGEFVIDEAASSAVLSAFAAHGTDLPIDYEHQSLGGSYASPTGQAPAAGWIRALRVVRPGEESQACDRAGLWAHVEWTDSGRERVAAREYRYLSPVVLIRKSDRRVVALHSAALTNKPAIVGMRPIVNCEEGALDTGHARVDAQPLDSSAPGEAGQSRAGRGRDTVLEGLRADLGLEQAADVDAVLLAASERLAGLMRERAEQAAAERVAAAARSGKVTEGLRAWALQLAMTDPARFDAWVAAAPVVVVTGRTPAPALGVSGRDRAAVIASARASYQHEPALSNLTSEEAWVAQALREAGMSA